MYKKILILPLFLFITAAAHSQALNVRFIGNASFLITNGQLTIVSDFPYTSGYSGYMHYDFKAVRPEGEVLSLITHRHADHFNPGLFASTNWYLIAPDEIDIDLSTERRLPLNEVIVFRGVKIHPIKTQHADTEHYSYLLEWDGYTFFFTGDTNSIEPLEEIREVDILFITPWLLEKAKQNDITMDVKQIVVYHQKAGEEIRCNNCAVLQQGEQFNLPLKTNKHE